MTVMLVFIFALLTTAMSTSAMYIPNGYAEWRKGKSHAQNIEPRNALDPWCQGLGGGAFDDARPFSLAAYSTNRDNANLTGVPLVVGDAGAINGGDLKVLSTYESFPRNQLSTFTLAQGTLTPTGTSSYGWAVADGSEPGFLVKAPDTNSPSSAQIYCAIAPTSPHGGGSGLPILAVNHDASNFSLCRTNNQPGSQVNVVYKPTPNNVGRYDYGSCYPVILQLVGLR